MQLPFGAYGPSKHQISFLRLLHAIPNTWIGRRLCLGLRKIFSKLFPQEFFDYQIEGIKARFCVRGNISERKFFFMPQFYDHYERSFIAQHLATDAVFVDIGANIGLYSLWAAKYLSKDGIIIAFEPNPEVFNRLKNNFSYNNFSCKVILKNIAVAATASDDVQLRLLDAKNLGSATIKNDARKSDTSSTRGGLTVTAQPLVDVLGQSGINKIDMLKVDVEGMEEDILLAFFDNAPKILYPKFIILENNKRLWQRDLLGCLLSIGYLVRYESKMNYVLALE